METVVKKTDTLAPSMNRFDNILQANNLSLRRGKLEILQINTGKLCNLTCSHCHVDAGPKRKEIMSRQTMDRIIHWLAGTNISTVDITGGAPEMIHDFRYLIEKIKALRPLRHIIDRCNLTILIEPEYEDLINFLARHEIEIIASLPCYSPKNVDAQRGDGVFDKSIQALQLLNQVGYGINPKLPLHLVYNPVGIFLPPPQAELEADYKAELKKHFGILFNRLYTITNMPIARFAAFLRHNGQYEPYMNLLMDSFNPHAVNGLMCRNTLSIGWRGEVYDCDFNQMLDMQWQNGKPLYLWDIDSKKLEGRPIMMADHCFGCTAGAGSSCTGALAN